MEKPSTSTIEASLRGTFSELANQLSAPPAAVQKWTDDLIARYTEPQRHYHTINHIHSMLSCLGENKKHIKNHTLVELAIYFHDWIYDPQAKDNELQSIDFFRAFADEVGLDKAMIEQVAGYIERTITHTLPTTSDGAEPDSDLCFFLDFDLEVLSRGEVDYGQYARQIREEYSHFSDGGYCVGRIKVLKSFLGRERLYFSGVFYERREGTARENLKDEIGSLEKELTGISEIG
jgi:predicted metal-dependent HD superfamily phosphohydrolase